MYRKLADYIDPNMTLKQKTLQSLKLFSYFPMLVFVQAIPRVGAVINFLFSRDQGWYKTERTREATMDPLADGVVDTVGG
jgi:hypothetical protein